MWVLVLLGLLAAALVGVKAWVSRDIDRAVTWDNETTQFHDWRELQRKK